MKAQVLQKDLILTRNILVTKSWHPKKSEILFCPDSFLHCWKIPLGTELTIAKLRNFTMAKMQGANFITIKIASKISKNFVNKKTKSDVQEGTLVRLFASLHSSQTTAWSMFLMINTTVIIKLTLKKLLNKNTLVLTRDVSKLLIISNKVQVVIKAAAKMVNSK